MNKPTKIQRTVEFDEVLEEAELIIHTEAMVGLQSIIKAIDDYSNIGRKDHEFLLMMIDDIRRRMYGVDIHLADAFSMVVAHRDRQSQPTKEQNDAGALAAAVDNLKASMVQKVGSDPEKQQESSGD